jgi:hypothetical protein
MKAGALSLIVLLGVAGCGSARTHRTATAHNAAVHALPRAHPQAVQPVAGQQAVGSANSSQAGVPEASVGPNDPFGDPTAHAPPLSEVRRELRRELVAVRPTSANYIDPLRFVSVWERTDQGVDAVMPVGAPILAPCEVKILGIEPDWYLTQPLVYFELLVGPDAGKVQYVAEEITDIARPGSIVQQGQTIARFARSGTGIEYGWSTPNGITLAVATTGYEEGQITPAGRAIRAWLNSLGANAGPNRH